MRRSSTSSGKPPAAGASAAKKATPTSAGPRKTAGAPPSLDDKEDYIMNLKGQVYLLTIENEMMKNGMEKGRPASSSSAAGMMSTSRGPVATPPVPRAAAPMPTTNELMTAGLPPAQYPGEIGDAFEMMRQKYAQLENKYQEDLSDSRRAAEALASQCAAQSSLITTLKKEVAADLDTIRQQKMVMQEMEQRSSSDLEKSGRDIDNLHERIAELNAIVAGKNDEIAQRNTTAADLRSVAANASAEKNAAEAARQRTLESYGRVYMVSRYLLQRWRAERKDKLAVLESFEKMRADKVIALERMDKAVSDGETATVAAEEAFHARERALAAHRETQAQINIVEQEVLRLTAEVELKTRLIADLDGAIPDSQRKVDTTQATAAKAVGQKESAIKRANELERLLADKAGEADELRSAAVQAEGRMREALSKVKGLEDSLAAAHARIKSVESSEKTLEMEIGKQVQDVEELGQRAAACEVEIMQLKDELSKRPPIDIIKQLDVENLMQRNMQAAAAMHQLLAWRDAHEVHPNVSLVDQGR